MIKLACTVLVALVVGYLAGRHTGDATGEPVRAAHAPTGTVAGCPPPAPSPRFTRTDIAVLKRELAPLMAPGTTAPAPPAEAEAREDETAESVAAAGRARAVLDQAVRAGVWTDEHAATLRGLMGQISPATEREVLSTLVAALNEQRLQLATMGPPL